MHLYCRCPFEWLRHAVWRSCEREKFNSWHILENVWFIHCNLNKWWFIYFIYEYRIGVLLVLQQQHFHSLWNEVFLCPCRNPFYHRLSIHFVEVRSLGSHFSWVRSAGVWMSNWLECLLTAAPLHNVSYRRLQHYLTFLCDHPAERREMKSENNYFITFFWNCVK